MKKYSNNFLRDIRWFIKVRNIFNFDGKFSYEIPHDKNGVDFLKAFFLFDAQGKIVPTRHPRALQTLLLVKGSVNLHIKMYAQDRAKGYLPKIEFDKICKGFKFKVPKWFIDAVEFQKQKYY